MRKRAAAKEDPRLLLSHSSFSASARELPTTGRRIDGVVVVVD